MKRRWSIVFLAAGLIGAGTFVVWAEEKESEGDEQKITADQVPPKAMEAIKKLAGSNKIEGFTKQDEYGVEGFEAEWQIEGKDHAIQVTADGVLLATEDAVEAREVPPAVQKTAQKALKGAKDISYLRKYIVVYEAEGKVKGKSHEIDINASGKLADEDEDKGTEKKSEK